MAAVQDDAEPRRQRSDGARNRARLLDEAERLFGEQGVAASLDELARRADVSSATLYRHFPTRELLFRALLDRLGEHIDTLLQEQVLAAPTAGQQVELLVVLSAELLIDYPGYRPIIAALQQLDPEYVPSDGYVPLFEGIVERAKAEGALRVDVVAADIQLASLMVGSLGSFAGMKETGLWRRYASFVMEGMRPHSAPATGTAPDRADLHRLMGPEGVVAPWPE